MQSTRLSVLVVVLTMLGGSALAGCGGSDDAARGAASTTASTATSTTVDPSSSTSGAPTATTVEVRTEVLSDLVDPPGADGRTLSLVRYTIAPGAKLAPHEHPGVQMAHIESGTLTYTVVSGTARVQRAGATDQVVATSPTTIELDAGDSVVEIDGMVHFGENRTAEPVVILASLLTQDGHDLAEKVTTETTTSPG
ncbi:MAG: cupin domain-containing protein [Actinomycetota bacterium]|nr:cupin domain-containing protein [Actinomycetota bacterium]